MSIKVICLGKTRESWIKQGIDEYLKRLTGIWELNWIILKDVSLKDVGTVDLVKSKEAVIIAKSIAQSDYLIVLDEHGKSFNSIDFAVTISGLIETRNITFVIGGVYGLDAAILKRADLILSFSAFTFPHQLIRLILAEQVYRAFAITNNKNYHY